MYNEYVLTTTLNTHVYCTNRIFLNYKKKLLKSTNQLIMHNAHTNLSAASGRELEQALPGRLAETQNSHIIKMLSGTHF